MGFAGSTEGQNEMIAASPEPAGMSGRLRFLIQREWVRLASLAVPGVGSEGNAAPSTIKKLKAGSLNRDIRCFVEHMPQAQSKTLSNEFWITCFGYTTKQERKISPSLLGCSLH